MTTKGTIKLLLSGVLLLRAVLAVVITAPGGLGKGQGTYVSPSPAAEVESTLQEQLISLRIRSTKESDLDSIAHMLAMALVDPYQQQQNGNLNFRLKMEILKAKAGYNPMLKSRLQALETGIKITDSVGLELDESDHLRYIWSNDGFRHKIQKAAGLSSEPHVWGRHNFAYAPRCPTSLQHKMFTAEDALTGKVVGFCEVAMLSAASETTCNDDEKTSMSAARPTVANLAVSPDYRRRGIASRMVNSASRFVRKEWNCQDLTLYVEKENKPALMAYSNLGFTVEADVHLKSTPHWYMVLQGGKQRTTTQPPVPVRLGWQDTLRSSSQSNKILN